MADIQELGESLLARTRQRNNDIYKRNRRDAFQMGLLNAGAGLIKNSIANQAQDFLAREDVLSARARQRQGYNDAQFTLQMKDTMDASGLTPLEFMQKQIRPELMARANLEFNEAGVDADAYGSYIEAESRKLAEERLEAFNQALVAAQGVSSPEDFDNFVQMRVNRNATGAGWITNVAKRLFGGKSKEELNEDTVNSIVESGMLQTAEEVTSLRNVFSQTGDLETAIDAAALAALPEVSTSVARSEVGEVVEVRGPWGGTMQVQLTNHFDSNGNFISQTERAIRGSLNASTSSNPELSQVAGALTEQDFTVMSENLQRVYNALPEDSQERYQDMISHVGLDENGQQALNQRLASMSALFNRGVSGTGADGANIGQEPAQRIMAQVMFNRMEQYQTEGGIFGWGRNVDLTQANFNDMPDAMEVALALGELDSKPATSFNYDTRQLAGMISTIGQDFGTSSEADQDGFLNLLSSDPDKYSFMFAPTPSGYSIFDMLVGIRNGTEPGQVTDTQETVDTTDELDDPVVEPGEVDPTEAQEEPSDTVGGRRRRQRGSDQSGSLTESISSLFTEEASTTDRRSDRHNTRLNYSDTTMLSNTELPDTIINQIGYLSGKDLSEEDVSRIESEVSELESTPGFDSLSTSDKNYVVQFNHMSDSNTDLVSQVITLLNNGERQQAADLMKNLRLERRSWTVDHIADGILR